MDQTTLSTPLARVRAAFVSKKDLIEKLKALATDEMWVGRLNEAKSWAGLSNRKLLRLHSVLNDVKDRFGSRAKLVDAVATALGHGTDADYKKRLVAWPLPRLLDTLKSATKRNDRDAPASAKAASAHATPKAAAAEKAPAAKKPAAAPKAEAGAKTAAPKAAAGSKPAAAEKAPAAKKPAAAKKKPAAS